MDERPIRIAIEACTKASSRAAGQGMAEDALRYAEAAKNLAETLDTLHFLDNPNP